MLGFAGTFISKQAPDKFERNNDNPVATVMVPFRNKRLTIIEGVLTGLN